MTGMLMTAEESGYAGGAGWGETYGVDGEGNRWWKAEQNVGVYIPTLRPKYFLTHSMSGKRFGCFGRYPMVGRARGLRAL